MAKPGYHIRQMTADEVMLAEDWAAAEGWNPGLHDAEIFGAADPDGFLIGELDGEPVSCISVVSYGEYFGFLGFYIVRPEFRGQGFGLKIWQAGLDRLAGRNVGLDGVVAQQQNYIKSGFALAWRNQRFAGTGGGEEPIGTVPLEDVPFETVLAYDTECFARPRPEFLRRWIDQPDSRALAVVDGVHLKGVGAIRACRNGHKIGPLFADDGAVAERLFSALVASVPGDPIFLDVPQPNPEALALVARHRMDPVFETARMYTAGDPGIPIDKVFGITSFELG